MPPTSRLALPALGMFILTWLLGRGWSDVDDFGPSPVSLDARYNASLSRFKYTDPLSGLAVGTGSGPLPTLPVFSSTDRYALLTTSKRSEYLLVTEFLLHGSTFSVTQASQNPLLTTLLGEPLDAFDVFVTYSGLSPFGNTIHTTAASVGDGFSLHDNTSGNEQFFAPGTQGETFILNSLAVPEPGLLSSAGLAAITLFGTRRRKGGGNPFLT